MSNHPPSPPLLSAANASSAGAAEQPLPPSLSPASSSSSSIPLSAVDESLRLLLLMQFRIHNGARAVGSDAGALLTQVHLTIDGMQQKMEKLQAANEQLLAERRLYTPSSVAATPLGDRPADAPASSTSLFNLKKRSLGESSSAASMMGAAAASAAASASLPSLSSPLQPESEQPMNKKQRHESKKKDELAEGEPASATASLGVQPAGSALQPLPAAAASSSISASDPTAPAITPAVAPAAAFVPISVQLVMQFLPLKGVCACARVCRSWWSAAASPFVWTGRTESLKYDTNENLTRWMKSRVLHNVRKVELESAVGRQPRQAVISLLDRLAQLPQLSELSFSTDARSALLLLNHPLWQRLPSIRVVGFISTSSSTSPMLKREELMAGLTKCTQLRKLYLEGGQLWPLERMPQLEELVVSSYDSLFALRITCMPHLRVLHLTLPIERVELLCGVGPATLISLCELQLRFEGPRYGAPVTAADESAAATFGVPVTSRTLLLCRLSCLGRLLTLQRLTLLHDDRCGDCTDPMLLLRLAQHRYARAFQQLREYAFEKKVEHPQAWRCPYDDAFWKYCSCDHEQEAELNPSNQRALLFPHLAIVHLDCCPPNFCSLPQFDQMCRQMPAVRILKLKMHRLERRRSGEEDRMAADALAWCRLPSLRKLTQLHTLVLESPLWRSDLVNMQSLADLHSLSALPGLAHLKITNVCEFQSRAEVNEILTTRKQR